MILLCTFQYLTIIYLFLHQIDKKFKSFYNKIKSENDFAIRNNFRSSANSNFREFMKCKSLMNNINSNEAK